MAASSDRSLRIIAQSNDKLQVVNGFVKGASVIHKFGAAEAVTTALTPITTALVWPTPTTATALEVVSTDNANDIPEGDGALTVEIHGIRTWAEETIESYALTGTTPVAVGSWLRVYRVKVTSSGVYAAHGTPSHNSTITLRVAAAGATWAIVGPASTGIGAAQSEIGAFSVPTGTHVHVTGIQINVDSAQAGNVFFFSREGADTVVAPFSPMQIKQAYRNIKGGLDVDFDYPLGPFTGPCDIGLMGQSAASTANIEGRMTILRELHV
jgi:hypothetical protein